MTHTPSPKARALNLGRIGIWSTCAHFPEGREAAAEVESLGFKTLWIPGGIDDTVLAKLDGLLEATSTLNFATGIINIWKHDPADLAAWWHGHDAADRARLFLGLGVSHGPLIGETWGKPLAVMRAFLDGLAAGNVPSARLCVAALGPKMLELAAARTAGSHPYLSSPHHTAVARAAMGPDAVVAPEQGVVLEPDLAKAREIGRGFIRNYARFPNYANNWRRDGFSDEEIEAISDRLVDNLIACGDLDAIARRVDEHIAAGADHVCLQVIGGPGSDISSDRATWRELATLDI